jgi:hypothetical protein
MKLLSSAALLVGAAAIFACSSGTTEGTGGAAGTGAGATTTTTTGDGTPVICLQPGAEGENCAINAPSTAMLVSDCAAANGKIVTTCPTAGLLGCCTTKLPGQLNEVCHYGGTASNLEANCSPGTWSTTQ